MKYFSIGAYKEFYLSQCSLTLFAFSRGNPFFFYAVSACLALHKSTSLTAPANPTKSLTPLRLAKFIVPSRLVEESMSPKQTMLLIANQWVDWRGAVLFANAARDRVKDSTLGLSWALWLGANAVVWILCSHIFYDSFIYGGRCENSW